MAKEKKSKEKTKVAVKVDIEPRYVVSALTSKKARNDLYYGDEPKSLRNYTQPMALEQACSTYKQWEGNTAYYRDVRLHEIGPGKRVRVKTEILEE